MTHSWALRLCVQRVCEEFTATDTIRYSKLRLNCSKSFNIYGFFNCAPDYTSFHLVGLFRPLLRTLD